MAQVLADRAAARRFTVNQNHDINVTPFIDIMLVLLIVFIIAAPLATTAINVDIAAGHVGVFRPSVNVMIDDRGAISIQGGGAAAVSTSLDRLGADVARAGGSPTRSWIIVTSAAHTHYGAFIAVMDRLNTDSFVNVTLADKTA